MYEKFLNPFIVWITRYYSLNVTIFAFDVRVKRWQNISIQRRNQEPSLWRGNRAKYSWSTEATIQKNEYTNNELHRALNVWIVTIHSYIFASAFSFHFSLRPINALAYEFCVNNEPFDCFLCRLLSICIGIPLRSMNQCKWQQKKAIISNETVHIPLQGVQIKSQCEIWNSDSDTRSIPK